MSGTPTSLLRLPSVFRTGPRVARIAAIISRVVVFPFEPVTPTTGIVEAPPVVARDRAERGEGVRDREERQRRRGCGRAVLRDDRGGRALRGGLGEVRVARRSARRESATKSAPGARVRVSVETPATSAGGAPIQRPPVAAASSSGEKRGMVMAPPACVERREAHDAVAERGTRRPSSAGVPGRHVEQRREESAPRRQAACAAAAQCEWVSPSVAEGPPGLLAVGEGALRRCRRSGSPRAPCRRRARRRPGARSETASAMAARRSGSTRKPRAPSCAAGPESRAVPVRSRPGRMSAMIAPGASVRGLSLVTTTTSAPRAATSPMSGRLPRSRSPPQPKTQTSRRGPSARSASSARASASSVWA